ncbi:hypothetical protein PSACC_03521 [Paramicrosporidium saccamoebae]|uniref:Uncharacterized protein n=1 Tax=Paramicrosporidium saccamoebae TaxID=1246581 RepID=A0A2H9TFW6_9FUNG|nr:hypothetical protein PSACC_03521 [Paramicrosporidium saccamoebae]
MAASLTMYASSWSSARPATRRAVAELDLRYRGLDYAKLALNKSLQRQSASHHHQSGPRLCATSQERNPRNKSDPHPDNVHSGTHPREHGRLKYQHS